MPRTGRPPKPVEQKRRTGNPGKRALPNGSVLAVVPIVEPDGWELGVRAALEKVLDLGVPWLGSTDNPTLALLADAMELHEKAKVGGSIRDQIEAMKAVSGLLSQLGFDPTARSRLGLAEVKAQSTLEAMRARSQAKVPNQDKSDRAGSG